MRILNSEQQKQVKGAVASSGLNGATDIEFESPTFDWENFGGAAAYGAITGVVIGGIWNFSGKSAQHFVVHMLISGVVGAGIGAAGNVFYQLKLK
ncbi:MAG: hypothetical protein V4490_03480 [Pseudomonadota bacterium]